MSALEGLTEIGRPRVLVLGDLILDHYVWGSVDRISPEAPIQILAVTEEEDRLGGAGNVAANLAEMDAEAYLIGVLGQDTGADRYLELCRQAGVKPRILRLGDRPTIRKSRYIAHSQQVLRVDHEEIRPLAAAQTAELIEHAESLIGGVDIVVLSDYAKGTLSIEVMQRIMAAAKRHGIGVVVDPKGTDFSRYRGATLITPNRREASLALGRPLDDEDSLVEAMQMLLDEVELEAVVITLGPEGIACLGRGGEPQFISARAQAVFDVSGAGDTVIAMLALFLGGGRPLAEAVEAANAGGGVVVGKLGTAQVSREEVQRALAVGDGVEGGKLITAAQLAPLLADLQAHGRKVVFTNGCYDLLHPGHVRLLTYARGCGDLLVLGLNSDASIRGLKGPTRPVLPEGARAELLCALEAVDYVVLFDDPTPQALIAALQPDVLVKGGDWADKTVVGADIVEARGGRVVLFPVQGEHSTTSIIDRIRAQEDA